jgi:endonuclease III
MSLVAELPSSPERWRELRDLLAGQHGRVRRNPLPLGNRQDPDEELLFILLTLMTRSQDAIEATLSAILDRAGVPPWEGIARVQRRTLVRLLQPVGLVNRRADQLRALARTVIDDHGGSLTTLAPLPDAALLCALEALPGVGRKSARCVAAYAFGRDMLAVDVHVLRLVKRLGLSPMEARWSDVDADLNEQVPRRLRYGLHVLLVQHGRSVCTCVGPACGSCVLAAGCPSAGVASESREDYVVDLRRPDRAQAVA